MNRGNLAEDPRAGLSSSSRYSRMGGEKNSLLYVDSSSVRKEKKAAERRNGTKNGTVKGNQKSNRKRNVGRGLADSHMDRLEVGSDGRLFAVKESAPSTKSSHKTASGSDVSAAVSKEQTLTGQQNKENATVIRPAVSEEVFSGTHETETAKKAEANETETAKRADNKPARDYLAKDMRNPLLSAAVLRTGSSEASRKEAKENFFRRCRVQIIAAAAAIASVGYGYTAWRYSNRFYPGTEFFGISAEEQTVEKVKAAVKAKVDSYSLELIARKPETDPASDSSSEGTSEPAAAVPAASADSGQAALSTAGNVIEAEDVAMVYRDSGEIDQAMKDQRSWAWPVMMIAGMFRNEESALETSYDEGLLPQVLDQLDCMQEENMIKPQDAQIIMTDDGAKVQSEVYGTTLNREKTEAAVKKALDTGLVSIDLDSEGLYESPEVFSSDLNLTSDAMAMNKVLGAKVLMRFGDSTEVINSDVIRNFLKKDGHSYILDEEKVREYVTDLAGKYDTYQCERELFTSIGTKFTLEAGVGDYGWQMDQEATYEKLLEAIRSQKKTTMEPVYTHEAYCRTAAGDIGETYVEISLTNQTMWFYKNGKLVVKTPVVTGNPYAGHETPYNGVWSLKGKSRNQLLSGQGYSSPVDYWMPFNNGVGIHDMQNRAWFGGTIYLGSGSHGCVNTPLSAVKLIYDQIEEGVPVIVYKDESDTALSLVTDPTDAQSVNAQIEETYGTVEDDGVGSIVYWTRVQQAQAAAAAAAASNNAATGTSVS